MNNKSNIRNILNKQRNNLTSQEHRKLSQEVCDNILSSSVFQDTHTIASYMSINNEVDLVSLFNPRNDFALPVILPDNSMCFNQYLPNIQLVKNKFGILEPKNNKLVPAESIDLCLLPLVGFNRQGCRLGMGGGYYDRYFELNQQKKKPTILAGIAYDFQEDDTIQADQWDIPLDMIFTNKEVIYCGQSR